MPYPTMPSLYMGAVERTDFFTPEELNKRNFAYNALRTVTLLESLGNPEWVPLVLVQQRFKYRQAFKQYFVERIEGFTIPRGRFVRPLFEMTDDHEKIKVTPYGKKIFKVKEQSILKQWAVEGFYTQVNELVLKEAVSPGLLSLTQHPQTNQEMFDRLCLYYVRSARNKEYLYYLYNRPGWNLAVSQIYPYLETHPAQGPVFGDDTSDKSKNQLLHSLPMVVESIKPLGDQEKRFRVCSRYYVEGEPQGFHNQAPAENPEPLVRFFPPPAPPAVAPNAVQPDAVVPHLVSFAKPVDLHMFYCMIGTYMSITNQTTVTLSQIEQNFPTDVNVQEALRRLLHDNRGDLGEKCFENSTGRHNEELIRLTGKGEEEVHDAINNIVQNRRPVLTGFDPVNFDSIPNIPGDDGMDEHVACLLVYSVHQEFGGAPVHVRSIKRDWALGPSTFQRFLSRLKHNSKIRADVGKGRSHLFHLDTVQVPGNDGGGDVEAQTVRLTYAGENFLKNQLGM